MTKKPFKQIVTEQKICSTLNVSRERFRVQEDGQYTWAGEA